MNHAITIGGLLLGIGALVGLLGCGFGALSIFADGMSDAPQASDGKSGCIIAIVSAVLLIGCIAGLVL